MISGTELIFSIVGAVFASTGFWAFLTFIIQRRDKRENAVAQMLKGLGHDRICNLGAAYIEQGYISKEDYENLHDYLYKPYVLLGGNGTAKKIMSEVEKLPLREREE